MDTLVVDGLWDAFNQYHMGNTAENLAKRHGITREQQDEYAVLSQSRARAAIAAEHSSRRSRRCWCRSARAILFPSSRTNSRARIRTWQPSRNCARAFDKSGTVTAGNASTLNDGAAAVLLMSADAAQRLGLPVLARIVGYASVGVDPAFMGEGPVPATNKVLAKAGWKLGDVDLIEANEAFAAQALSVAKLLEFDISKVNVNGGAIALGHPIGASGCRVLVTLIHEWHDATRSVALQRSASVADRAWRSRWNAADNLIWLNRAPGYFQHQFGQAVGGIKHTDAPGARRHGGKPGRIGGKRIDFSGEAVRREALLQDTDGTSGLFQHERIRGLILIERMWQRHEDRRPADLLKAPRTVPAPERDTTRWLAAMRAGRSAKKGAMSWATCARV